MRLVANDRIAVHPYVERPNPMRAMEYDVPVEATRGGDLVLRWFSEKGQGGFTSSVRIAEVCLVRSPRTDAGVSPSTKDDD